jgi:hypothetical protein
MSNVHGIGDNFDESSAESINRTQLDYGDEEGPGIEYTVQLINARRLIDRNSDPGFFLDCVVLESGSGGSAPGTEFCYVWYPDKKADYKAKKEGELKRNLGAFFGLEASASTKGVNTQAIANAYVDRGNAATKTFINQNVNSPLRGRVARVLCRPYKSKSKGKYTGIYDFKPYLEDGQVVTRPVAHAAPATGTTTHDQPENVAVPSAPPPVTAPAANTPFPPPGWAKNPNDPSGQWYYEIANVDNQKTEAQLRAVA